MFKNQARKSLFNESFRLEWTNNENANSLWKFIIIFGKIAVRLFEAVRRLNLTKAFIINSSPEKNCRL